MAKQKKATALKLTGIKVRKVYGDVVEAFKSGLTVSDISQRVGLSKGMIYKYLRHAREKGDIQHRAITLQHYLQIVGLLRDGKQTLEDIGSQHGLTRQRVAQIQTLAVESGLIQAPKK